MLVFGPRAPFGQASKRVPEPLAMHPRESIADTPQTSSLAPLEITDPMVENQSAPGAIGRFVAKGLRNEGDLAFVKLAALMTALFVPLAAVMFIPGWFRWWQVGVYWVLYLWFLGPFVLMLHNTSHRVLFARKFSLLNRYIPWVVGPFVGMSPETYYVHHMALHHVEGNLPDDLSSTMKYRRDSFIDFLKYYFTFLVSHFELSAYLRRRGRTKMIARFWSGELAYIGATALLFFVDWRPALFVFAIPLVFTRFMLMAGNWAQHAFVDPEDSTNDYRTVITFINSKYNHRCFNDGYHLGHHLKASRHWLDMPADFLAKREEMIAQRSLVFEKLDYFMVFALLMLKRHRTLAKFVVQLDPNNPVSEEEILALFERRLRPFGAVALAELSTAHA